ncbi:siroheme synthase [Citrobacter freundii]|nr:siroheme synthase [Citrobacter freundii]
MDHLPIFCQLRDRDCLIVGGGDVAERKARLLLEAGARITVNALAFIPQFKVWADEGMLTLVEGPFDESLLDTCWLAIAATDDDTVNQSVSTAAESRRIFCNVVDAPKAASFYHALHYRPLAADGGGLLWRYIAGACPSAA